MHMNVCMYKQAKQVIFKACVICSNSINYSSLLRFHILIDKFTTAAN